MKKWSQRVELPWLLGGETVSLYPEALRECSVGETPQEGPEENSAYEQLLSHLEEITEEGQFVGLATNLCGLVHKESPLGASGLRLEMGSLQCRRD